MEHWVAVTDMAIQTIAELPEHLREAYQILASGAAQILPEGGLSDKLLTADREGRPLRVKLGIDPSGTDLTLGHAVVLRKLRQFQDLGHLAVLVVGDFTGQIGDPTGRTDTRTMRTAQDTERNSAGYFEQLMRILDPERVEIRRNSEWLGPMTMTDVMRNAKLLTIAQLLERDDFSRRYRDGLPISLVEFMYPMLQGIDSVAVRADVELGGTDQTYNNLVGRTMQRADGQPPQAVLTMPLLEGLDGVEKMGKSLNNYVAIAEPPAEQFGKLMSIPDSMVARYARLCTAMHPRRIAELEADVAAGGPRANSAKRAVARAVVALYHGEQAAQQAEEHFDAVFRARRAPADLPTHPAPATDPVHLPALLVELGFAPSNSAARRLVDQGAVRMDGAPVNGYDVPREALTGTVLAAGRRRQVRIEP